MTMPKITVPSKPEAPAEDVKERLEKLVQCPLFKGIGSERLAPVASLCRITECYRGQTLMEEGNTARELLFILSGKVEVRVESISPNMEVGITRLGPREILGETLLLGHEIRHVTVMASERCTILHLPAEELLEMIAEDAVFGRTVLQNVAEVLAYRLRRTNQRLVNQMRHLCF